MNDEAARQGRPDNNTHPTSRLALLGDDVRIPSVSLVVELERSPRIVVDATNEADELALRAWIRECRPDVDGFLRGIARELRERRVA